MVPSRVICRPLPSAWHTTVTRMRLSADAMVSGAVQPTATLAPRPTEAPAESSAISSTDGTSSDEKASSSAYSLGEKGENSAESTAASSSDVTSESDSDFVYYESLEDFPGLKLSVDETGNGLCKDSAPWFAAPGTFQISGEMVSAGRIIGIRIFNPKYPESFAWQFFDSLENKEIERIEHRTIYFDGGEMLSF